MFHMGYHPIYSAILFRDMMLRVQLPEQISTQVKENESFSVTTHNNRSEGLDFLLEHVNRLVKSFLPPGTPTVEIWRRICRKAEVLSDLRKQVMRYLRFDLQFF